MSGALQGDLGNSMVPPRAGDRQHQCRTAGEYPVGGDGSFIAIVVAVPLAMYSARHQGGWIDRAISACTFGVLSIPSFLSGLLRSW
ncbi:hypothetical protein GS545_25410 [Rhodococcus hoagii]|nr:hypothetical protein [Prescottella equi]